MAILTAGKLTGGDIEDLLRSKNIHPTVIEKMKGGGLLANLIKGINMASEFYSNNKDTINGAIKTGLDLYKTINGGKLTAGKLTGGSIETGGKIHKKKLLASYSRSKAVGILMKSKANGGEGMKMADAQLYYNNHVKALADKRKK